MEVNWTNSSIQKRWNQPPKRQFLDIMLTDDTAANDIKIKFGQLYIREILANKDTVHGVDFHFFDQCIYATLVDVLDIANIEDVRVYIPSDDGIKFYYSPEHQIEKTIPKIIQMPL